jgi:uncharacterized paraquat-inducible protein A
MRTLVLWSRALGVALALALFGAAEVAACPNCKEAVSATPEESASLADGFNWSVLFMLAVPFSLMGTGALMVRQAVKKGAFPEL